MSELQWEWYAINPSSMRVVKKTCVFSYNKYEAYTIPWDLSNNKSWWINH